jgi:hypothetical protein
VYNFIAQHNNRLNIEVACDSKSIAEASKHDSSAMKTITVLTIVFLPGTFVAVHVISVIPAILSQSDTQYEADRETGFVLCPNVLLGCPSDTAHPFFSFLDLWGHHSSINIVCAVDLIPLDSEKVSGDTCS